MQESGQEQILSDGTLISNRYTVKRLLGQGGMGSVYTVADRVLGGQSLALKVLHRDMCQDEGLIKRFLREVELMHKVNHPNVVRTFDVGIDGSLVYFTMELVTGKPLDHVLEHYAEIEERLPPHTIAQIGEQIAAGLEAIHNADIVHRDLKPQNVLLIEDGTVKITDFGVARPADSKLTKHSEILGSIHYIAPEVWLGQRLTPSVDLYSLGIMLYELTTGQLPFPGEEPARLMWMHSKQQPKPPRSLRPDTPNWLNQIVLSLLQKQPGQRPKSAAAVKSFLAANRENNSQFIRAPEMIDGGEPSSTLVITSQKNTSVETPTVVYRPSVDDPPKEQKSYGWLAIALSLVACAILIPMRELCACTSMQEHIFRTLGMPLNSTMDANHLAPQLDRFTPSGLSRTVAEKKLRVLAGENPSRCIAVDNLSFRCRMELRKGIARARVIEVTLEYDPQSPDMVSQILVRDFTEFFGMIFRPRN